MLDLINRYLKEKEFAWSERTKESASCTLRSLIPYLTGDPITLWQQLEKTQKPYSRVTTWGRVVPFWDFAKPNEANPYREFRTKNRRLFRDKYIRRPASEGVAEACEKIKSITDPAIRKKAMELLLTGMRWTESFTLKDGLIMGKGDYPREVSLPLIEGPEYTGGYRTFLRALKDVGLKTHTLRKIYLSECAENGANPFELMTIAGWKSMEYATSYIGAKRSRIKEITERVRNGHDGKGKRSVS